MGKLRCVIRLGDLVRCPKRGHGITAIIEAEPTFKDQGKPVALDGHHAGSFSFLTTSGDKWLGTAVVLIVALVLSHLHNLVFLTLNKVIRFNFKLSDNSHIDADDKKKKLDALYPQFTVMQTGTRYSDTKTFYKGQDGSLYQDSLSYFLIKQSDKLLESE